MLLQRRFRYRVVGRPDFQLRGAQMDIVRQDSMAMLARAFSFQKKFVIQVGCGDGKISKLLAPHCRWLLGLEPDLDKVKKLNQLGIPRTQFKAWSPLTLGSTRAFIEAADAVLFTSYHLVPASFRWSVIDAALHAVLAEGRIAFFEPGTHGSYYEARRRFGLEPPGEEEKKRAAQTFVQESPRLVSVAFLSSVTKYQFDSVGDFLKSFGPRTNAGKVKTFLRECGYCLEAESTISVYRPRRAA